MSEIINNDYLNDLQKIKDTIKENRNKANLIEPTSSISIKSDDSLNEIFKDTYVFDFLDKNEIKTEKDLKNQMIDNIIRFLQELGSGFSLVGKEYSYNNLKYMSQVAKEFSFYEISQQLVGQIPWGTLVSVIMPKSYSHEEMLWYINETHKNGWSRSMVLNQIALKAYERSLIEPNTTSIVKSDDLANELFKDTYVFSFLDKNNIKTEKDLKKQMIDNIILFLQELGPGFSLVGKEYKLVTPTNEEFFTDLLMYHTKLHSYVVIEVKIGKFDPRDLGQLIFYVNAVDRLERTDRDDQTIGLLLCKEADRFIAETTLMNNFSKLGISKYKLLEELPEYLEKRLKEK